MAKLKVGEKEVYEWDRVESIWNLIDQIWNEFVFFIEVFGGCVWLISDDVSLV